jgi:acetolactate synthase-1/3 small subunit
MRHIISMLVENHQGVLARISGLFSGRGYNLESITVGVTMDPAVSRITLTCSGEDAVVEQIKKQLNRLIDVIKVMDLTGVPSLNRELTLIKVSARSRHRGEIIQVADVFKAQVVDVGHDTMSVELVGSPEKIDDFLALIAPYGIVEMARSGVVSMERSRKVPGPAGAAGAAGAASGAAGSGAAAEAAVPAGAAAASGAAAPGAGAGAQPTTSAGAAGAGSAAAAPPGVSGKAS